MLFTANTTSKVEIFHFTKKVNYTPVTIRLYRLFAENLRDRCNIASEMQHIAMFTATTRFAPDATTIY